MASVPTSGGDIDIAQLPETGTRRAINVLVVSSVALAFISFWRAAAIVLCDLASTAYYIGGISEQAIGKAAPWFILGVMLFSYAVRAVYVESCTMFTRGGVYRVVKGAIGGGLAKLSVSALMFDYILTGPISAVAAGQYMVGLFVDMANLILRHYGFHPIDPTGETIKRLINGGTVLLAVFITVYFWRANIIGIHESSDKALRIMQLTTVMGVLIIGWSILTIVLRHIPLQAPPLHPVFTDSGIGGNESSKGWLEDFPRIIGALGILVAFGHTLLAMSGEESLAQVNREIEAPKLKNLLRAGFVIFLYSMLLTSLISFFAIYIIPDGKRVKTMVVENGHAAVVQGTDYVEVDYLRERDANHPRDWGMRLHRWTDGKGDEHLDKTNELVMLDAHHHVQRDDGGYRDNLINGLVQYLAGPSLLKIIMECFVVTVGFLILAGAVNTSMVGSNGVLNRLAEDGVLTPWFQHPHPRFGTTHRLINLITTLQIVVIVASFGDVDTLGEAYAFGVIWSFVFMTMSMAFLRFKDRSPRQYRVPLNIHINTKSNGQIDIPIGIFTVFLILLSTALMNLLTKKTATIWGVGFTVAFLVVFILVERISHRRHGGKHEHLEQFNERSSEGLSIEALGLKHPKPVLVAARGPRSLPVLQKILQEIDTDQRDVVVVTCKVLPARTLGVTLQETTMDDGDRDLLTKIVTVAEQVGKQVHPVVLPTNNPLYAIATAARDLKANEVVLGVSEKMQAETQLEQFALAWGSATADPMFSDIAHDMTVRIVGPQVEMRYQME
ncbi:MAG TPA: APC family permease [Tepidisphaeraceae bacterium]|jgi:amino acid transporter|nr:APC family permease [Tepidisphaeraceae bacterium]